MFFKLSTAIMLAGLCCCAVSAAESKERPNIIFILADDLGINDLGCYGRKDQATPHLDNRRVPTTSPCGTLLTVPSAFTVYSAPRRCPRRIKPIWSFG